VVLATVDKSHQFFASILAGNNHTTSACLIRHFIPRLGPPLAALFAESYLSLMEPNISSRYPERRLANVATSSFGTKRICRGGLTMSALEGRTDLSFTSQFDQRTSGLCNKQLEASPYQCTQLT
jgi:hypothetical protein